MSDLEYPLEGRRAIITGASRGLGAAVAEAFVHAGASVLLAARTSEQLTETARSLEPALAHGQIILTHSGDISRPDVVKELTRRAEHELGGVDVLVCNAGVLGAIGPVDQTDWDEWLRAIQVNLLGTVLCCRAIVPIMRRQGRGKIVALSGGGATSPIAGFSAYGASKAGLVRFIETLAVELAGTGVEVNAVAPGTLDTRLLDETIAAGPSQLTPAFIEQSLAQKRAGGTPLQVPADLITFLASSASDGITGRLISAVWDDWRHLPEMVEKLRGSDVFTLRRIVLSDRGWTDT